MGLLATFYSPSNVTKLYCLTVQYTLGQVVTDESDDESESDNLLRLNVTVKLVENNIQNASVAGYRAML